MSFILNHTFAADGQSPVYQHPGGVVTLFSQLSFGGGTAKVEFSIDGQVTWDDVNTEGADIFDTTIAGTINAQLGPCDLRVDLSGATAPTLKVRLGLAEFG